MRRVLVTVVATLAVVAFALAFTLASRSSTPSVRRVAVPQLHGLSQRRMRVETADLGLRLDLNVIPVCEVMGQVPGIIQEYPPPGALVAAGSKVWVSWSAVNCIPRS